MSYQQFFKKAQEAKRGETVKPGPAPQFKIKAKRPLSEEEVDRRLRRAMMPKKAAEGSRRARRKGPPWKAVTGLVLSLGFAGFYLAAPEKIEKLFEKIEISAMGAAGAAETKAAEKSASAASAKEKAAAKEEKASPDKGPEAKDSVAEDFSHFEKLKQRKEELDRREKELSELEEELQRQKVELDKRIQQLEDTRNQIAQILKDRVEVDQEKVAKLVDLYSNMKPKQAAEVIGSINEDLAVEVLAKMKKKSAAEIMNLLPAEKSRVLSEKYTGYRRNHPDQKG
jgi:flagellar motility protein MotE (MotC chaperone)